MVKDNSSKIKFLGILQIDLQLYEKSTNHPKKGKKKKEK
jgi:hypothetical protein